ncbi:MAG: LicD family protein [Bacilli bacterium]|nr:LicD family protein [Bacilli bacterium]
MDNFKLKKQIDYIVDDNIYPIKKDIDGNIVNNKELQALLLDMVLELDRVCRKNNIPYALGFGSALGLFNYHGFIPWDDDMDIVIDYEDINRLIDAFNRDLDSKYYFDCYEDDKRYNVLIPTFKLKMHGTFLKEKNYYTIPNRCKKGNGIFIDIVAFMGVPSTKKAHRKLLRYAKNRLVPYFILDSIFHIQPYKMKKHIKEYEAKIYEQYKDSPTVSQTVIIPFQNWSTVVNQLAFPREVIYPFKEYDFMGHKLYSFNDLEEFCRLRYGDKSLKKLVNDHYEDPFPKRKRKVGHIWAISLKREK